MVKPGAYGDDNEAAHEAYSPAVVLHAPPGQQVEAIGDSGEDDDLRQPHAANVVLPERYVNGKRRCLSQPRSLQTPAIFI